MKFLLSLLLPQIHVLTYPKASFSPHHHGSDPPPLHTKEPFQQKCWKSSGLSRRFLRVNVKGRLCAGPLTTSSSHVVQPLSCRASTTFTWQKWRRLCGTVSHTAMSRSHGVFPFKMQWAVSVWGDVLLNTLFLHWNCKFSHKVKNRPDGSYSAALMCLAALLKVFHTGFCSRSRAAD